MPDSQASVYSQKKACPGQDLIALAGKIMHETPLLVEEKEQA